MSCIFCFKGAGPLWHVVDYYVFILLILSLTWVYTVATTSSLFRIGGTWFGSKDLFVAWACRSATFVTASLTSLTLLFNASCLFYSTDILLSNWSCISCILNKCVMIAFVPLWHDVQYQLICCCSSLISTWYSASDTFWHSLWYHPIQMSRAIALSLFLTSRLQSWQTLLSLSLTWS